MQNRIMSMSQAEMDRLLMIQRINCKELTQKEAAEKLKLSTRQVRRLQSRYQKGGAPELCSKRRGSPSNNRLKNPCTEEAIALIKAHYVDFGPTFAHEKLTEKHNIQLSVESLRQLMLKAGLWKGKKRKRLTVHPNRPRRSCVGELVQIDGSPHDWFEGRAPRCCLHVFIDDATSQLMQLHLILSNQYDRKLSKNLEISYNNVLYQVRLDKPGYALRGATIRVIDSGKQISLIYKGQALPYTTFDKHNRPAPVVSAKQVAIKKAYKPSVLHPWKRTFQDAPAKPQTAAL